MHKKEKYAAPALDKGLDVLEFLSSSSCACSQADIAQGVGRSANEIYRILVGLEKRGYLVRDEASGKYWLSLKLYTLAHTHSPIEQLRTAALLPMHALAEKLGQACHLSVLYQNQVLVISQVKSPEPVSLSISEGTLFPLLSTTSGRVLLAHMTDEQRVLALRGTDGEASHNSQMNTDLPEQLERIRHEGFHLANSEITQGVTDCACFIGEARSGLLAALAVSSLTTSINRRTEEADLGAAVKSCADDIQSRIGLGH